MPRVYRDVRTYIHRGEKLSLGGVARRVTSILVGGARGNLPCGRGRTTPASSLSADPPNFFLEKTPEGVDSVIDTNFNSSAEMCN